MIYTKICHKKEPQHSRANVGPSVSKATDVFKTSRIYKPKELGWNTWIYMENKGYVISAPGETADARKMPILN